MLKSLKEQQNKKMSKDPKQIKLTTEKGRLLFKGCIRVDIGSNCQ